MSDWETIKTGIKGVARALADKFKFEGFHEDSIHLQLSSEWSPLYSAKIRSVIVAAIEKHYGRPIVVVITIQPLRK